MNKRKILLIELLFFSFFSSAQVNLIPNSSFEVYDTCPNTSSQIRYAVPWFQPNETGGSTDYYNICDTGNHLAYVPSNWAGFQYPYSGNAYAGFATTIWAYDTIDREYLEVRLLDVLETSKKYCVSFYVSFASLINAHLPTSAIGAYFSKDSALYYSANYSTFHVIPQIANHYDSIISDTASWTVIKGLLNSEGGEQYITIGNFWDPPYVNTLCIGSPCAGSYYYIDDVSVVALPEIGRHK